MNSTRLRSTAFLFNNDKVLMLKRATDRKIAPGLWTGIGGHLEPEEINDPKRACIREIYEETGIVQEEIRELKLKYILLRLKGTEVREQFVFFGETTKQEVIDTVEGSLYWVNIDTIHTLDMPWIIKSMIEHYLEIDRSFEEQYVGVMTVSLENTPEMRWTQLIDPLIL